jgi:prepilin-type N-terminal cleavage/methylation domain-containing protein
MACSPRLRVALIRRGGFTLIELLTVMAVIAILAALSLVIYSWANKKSALANAETQIRAIEVACDNYKSDTGSYPHQGLAVSGSIGPIIYSDQLNPRTNGNSLYTPGSPYVNASLELYETLTGDLRCTGTSGGASARNYLPDVTPSIFGRSNINAPVSASNPVLYLTDPFTNVFGYSTAYATQIANANGAVITTGSGYNPTYDLWCTGGQSATPGGSPDVTLQWKDNW